MEKKWLAPAVLAVLLATSEAKATNMPPAIWFPAASTNYDTSRSPIDMVVIHKAEGSTYSAAVTFQNPIRRDGQLLSGFIEIWWQGRTAWIYAAYTRYESHSAARVDTAALNVRAGPSTGYAILGLSHQGQIYVQTGSASGWRRIDFDGRQLWISGAYSNGLTVSG